MSTESNGISAAEFRALGRLMRFARSQGYTYYVTTFLGATDWTWSKDHVYAVVAVPRAEGWHVDLPTAHVDMRPASVQQLTDVMVAVGLLPIQFRSAVPTPAFPISEQVEAVAARKAEVHAAALRQAEIAEPVQNAEVQA
jgi:hypothetical protein